MKRLSLTLIVFLVGCATAPVQPPAPTPCLVILPPCFSPKGGCTNAIVQELDKAKSSILVQAYSFTSAPIAKVLVAAHERGVKVIWAREVLAPEAAVTPRKQVHGRAQGPEDRA